MRKLMLLFLAMTLTACAAIETPQSIAAKSLLSTRQAVTAGATTADALCKAKVIKPMDCLTIKDQYEKFQLGYNIASDAFIIYVQTADEKQWSAASATFSQLAADTLACLNAYGGKNP